MEKIHPDQKERKQSPIYTVEAPISVGLINLDPRFNLDDASYIKLKTEAQKRNSLSTQFKDIFTKIGDMDLDTAIENGKIEKSEVNQFYKKLNEFLLEDDNNLRIILYLPFQILPDLNKETTDEKENLGQILRHGFIRLLHESEVRANFNDGDILEPGMPEPQRTRKVGHLLPQFLEKNIISVNDVISLIDTSHDKEMPKAIFEGVVVAHDQNLLENKDWEILLKRAEEKGVAGILDFGEISEDHFGESLDDIHKEMDASLDVIDLIYSEESGYIKNISSKRAGWEKGVRVNEVIEETAQKLAKKIELDGITTKNLQKFGIAGIRAMIRYVETVASTNPTKARKLMENSFSFFKKYWSRGKFNECEEIRVGSRRLEKLGALPAKFIKEFKIKIVDFLQPLPINIDEFALNEGKLFTDYAKIIESDPLLAEYFYPYFLVFGSRIKGYADQNGDFDFAVFIKPNVSLEQRADALSALHKKLPKFTKVDKILEYWVDEKDGKLGLKTISRDNSRTIVGMDQIHFLFGGVWIGETKGIQKLRSDLVSSYLNLNNFGSQKDAMRFKLLAQLEVDVLQYRLMHKGFRKNYPANKPKAPIHGNLIDWESDFWDTGYRKIATQLFLKKVFLPDLS